MTKPFNPLELIAIVKSTFPLEVSSEQLTERFVRGDSSRTTEGSGLGLSIAQSLTTIQGGIFKLKNDGDLFKVGKTSLSCINFHKKIILTIINTDYKYPVNVFIYTNTKSINLCELFDKLYF